MDFSIAFVGTQRNSDYKPRWDMLKRTILDEAERAGTNMNTGFQAVRTFAFRMTMMVIVLTGSLHAAQSPKNVAPPADSAKNERWLPLGSDVNNDEFYIDTKTIDHGQIVIAVWIKKILSAASKKEEASAWLDSDFKPLTPEAIDRVSNSNGKWHLLIAMQVDCKMKLIRYVERQLFMNDKFVSKQGISQEGAVWKLIAPETVAESIYDKACR